MKRRLSSIFFNLLNGSDCHSTGLVDRNGLVIHAEGSGTEATAAAALIQGLFGSGVGKLAEHFGDALDEQIVIGEAHCFYLRRLERGVVFYVVDKGNAPRGSIRTAMRHAQQQLEPLLNNQGLLYPLRQRLEQPRQLSNRLTTG